jgi:hypothetical protein
MFLKLIIRNSNHLDLSLQCLKMLGYEFRDPSVTPYAVIVNEETRKVSFIKTEKYEKDGELFTYFPEAQVVYDLSVKRSNRSNTGRKIQRLEDGKIYKDIHELKSDNPRANHSAKIYQAISQNAKMYGYHWAYIEEPNPQLSLFDSL